MLPNMMMLDNEADCHGHSTQQRRDERLGVEETQPRLQQQPPDLYELVVTQNRWSEVERLATCEPAAIRNFVDPAFGCTALHLVGNIYPGDEGPTSPGGNSVQLLLPALLRAHPTALRHADSNGSLPLHVLSYRTVPTACVRAMVGLYPEALRIRNRHGQTPVDRMCWEIHQELVLCSEQLDRWHRWTMEGAGGVHYDDTFRIFAECCLKKDEHDFCSTPLYNLWRTGCLLIQTSYRMGKRRVDDETLLMTLPNADTVKSGDSNIRVDNPKEGILDCSSGNVQQRSVIDHYHEEQEQHQIVHACAGTWGCSGVFLRLALARFPHQLTEFDRDGKLPLHVAAATARPPTDDDQNNIMHVEEVMSEEDDEPFASLADDLGVGGNVSFSTMMEVEDDSFGDGGDDDDGDDRQAHEVGGSGVADDDSMIVVVRQQVRHDDAAAPNDPQGEEEMTLHDDEEDDDEYAFGSGDDKVIVAPSSGHGSANFQTLLEAYPHAARVRDRRDNRLPLHVALVSNWPCNCTVSSLLSSYPGSVIERDRVTGLYPFMLAAAAKDLGGDDDDDDEESAEVNALTSVYVLLRACPEMERFRGVGSGGQQRRIACV